MIDVYLESSDDHLDVLGSFHSPSISVGVICTSRLTLYIILVPYMYIKLYYSSMYHIMSIVVLYR